MQGRSWEDGIAKAGAVFFNGSSGKGWIAEVEVPEELIHFWLERVGSQLICQIEFFALLVLRLKVADELTNQKSIAWIDNEAARDPEIG